MIYLNSPKAMFRVDKNGINQTGMSQNVWTQVTFGTERFDIGGYFASDTWTPPAGKVFIVGQVGFGGTIAAGSAACAGIFKNGGGTPFAYCCSYADSSNIATAYVSCTDDANGTDAYTLYGLHPGTASRSFLGNTDYTYFHGYWISP